MRQAIFAVLGWLAALAGPALAETYRNPEYGFAVELPPGLPTCRRPIGEPDQGIAVFLDAGPGGCISAGARPLVTLFGRYNADHRPSPEAELRRVCALLPGRQMPAPPDLTIGDLDSAACRVNRTGGWVDILVVAQAGARPETMGATGTIAQATPFINYTALLHTHIRRLDRDIDTLRLLLDRISIDK
ncbi:hypothetical protein [Desertibaculum subflavum]|uniref:hypothetical protein n=1 Tax=Desertibaculum subflavum TaxID=2268458 RepID=UPI000E674704